MANLGEAARVDWEVDGEDAGGRGHEHHGAVVGHEGEPARRGDRLSKNVNVMITFVKEVAFIRVSGIKSWYYIH